jgi:hypothetical protein
MRLNRRKILEFSDEHPAFEIFYKNEIEAKSYTGNIQIGSELWSPTQTDAGKRFIGNHTNMKGQ